MKVRKLTLDESLEIDFECIAIHALVEDYHLAYLINKHLHLKLKRKKKDLDVSNGQYKFPIFEWEDSTLFNKWDLIPNFIFEEIIEPSDQLELFANQIIKTKKHFLISDLNHVEYFFRLRQPSNYIDINSVIKKINTISDVVTSHKLELKKLKHSEHLTLE